MQSNKVKAGVPSREMKLSLDAPKLWSQDENVIEPSVKDVRYRKLSLRGTIKRRVNFTRVMRRMARWGFTRS